MIKVENIYTCGWEAALRGMRNPMNSWRFSDSTFGIDDVDINIGPADLALMMRLAKSGTDHRKYLRMIHIQMDVIAPLYWWKDYDTYKVATTSNGCSTMHKLHAKELTLDDFSKEDLDEIGVNILQTTIDYINYHRYRFVVDGDKESWRKMIQSLPTSYNQRRTLDINYETAISMIHSRHNHKLQEFRDLCNILLVECPYLKEIYEYVEGK
jgi:hypothetical protein